MDFSGGGCEQAGQGTGIAGGARPWLSDLVGVSRPCGSGRLPARRCGDRLARGQAGTRHTPQTQPAGTGGLTPAATSRRIHARPGFTAWASTNTPTLNWSPARKQTWCSPSAAAPPRSTAHHATGGAAAGHVTSRQTDSGFRCNVVPGLREVVPFIACWRANCQAHLPSAGHPGRAVPNVP
jgi:hypothetical protein